MKSFIEYVYYRIAHAMIHFGWSKKYSFECSYIDVGFCIAANTVEIILVLIYLTYGPISTESQKIISILSPILPAALMIFKYYDKFNDEIFYEHLDEKYRDEKHRILKGCLVFLYFLFSVLMIVVVAWLPK